MTYVYPGGAMVQVLPYQDRSLPLHAADYIFREADKGVTGGWHHRGAYWDVEKRESMISIWKGLICLSYFMKKH